MYTHIAWPRCPLVTRVALSEEESVGNTLIVRNTEESFIKMMETPYEELIKAGVFVAVAGLDHPSQSVVVAFTGETPVVTDGPLVRPRSCSAGST
jgi:hypothetical protein